MNRLKSQIDYILINRRWQNSLKYYGSYSNFASIESNYWVLSAKLRLNLRAKTAISRRNIYIYIYIYIYITYHILETYHKITSLLTRNILIHMLRV